MNSQQAGWHPDPQDPMKQRYWDGLKWTEHTAPRYAPPSVPPLGQKTFVPQPTKGFTPSGPPSLFWKRKRFAIPMGLCVGIAVIAVLTPKQSSTSLDTTMAISVVEAIETLAPTQTPKLYIPGLTSADVKLNLQSRGFNCDDDPNPLCTDQQGNSVDWHGSTPDDITNLTAMDPSADYAFVIFMASLPYQGADPAAAQNWVRENAPRVAQGQPAETVIGGARLTLVGSPGKMLSFESSKCIPGGFDERCYG
jgi:Protein of unknown function (DUF2510)